MPEKYMTCPNCGTQVLATEESAYAVAEKVRREYEYRSMEEDKEYKKKYAEIEKEFEEKLTQERTKLEREVRQQAEPSVMIKYKELKAKYEKRSRQLEQVTKEITNLRRRQRELEEALEKTELDMVVNLQKEEAWQQKVAGYLEGPEFQQHLSDMVEAVFGVKEALDAERSAIEQLWERQGRKIEGAIEHTAEMYGRFKEMLGSSLLHIKSLDGPSDH